MYDCLDGVYDHEADDRCIHSSPGHDPHFMYASRNSGAIRRNSGAIL